MKYHNWDVNWTTKGNYNHPILRAICEMFPTTQHWSPSATDIDRTDICRINWNSSLANVTFDQSQHKVVAPWMKSVSQPACAHVYSDRRVLVQYGDYWNTRDAGYNM